MTLVSIIKACAEVDVGQHRVQREPWLLFADKLPRLSFRQRLGGSVHGVRALGLVRRPTGGVGDSLVVPGLCRHRRWIVRLGDQSRRRGGSQHEPLHALFLRCGREGVDGALDASWDDCVGVWVHRIVRRGVYDGRHPCQFTKSGSLML